MIIDDQNLRSNHDIVFYLHCEHPDRSSVKRDLILTGWLAHATFRGVVQQRCLEPEPRLRLQLQPKQNEGRAYWWANRTLADTKKGLAGRGIIVDDGEGLLPQWKAEPLGAEREMHVRDGRRTGAV